MQSKLPRQISIECKYQISENPRGKHELVPTIFLVELTLDDDGTVVSWAVDDRTACFYTDLTKYNESAIMFEGSEIKGQTGSLLIDRNKATFIQKSDVNGEWLVLEGTSEETFYYELFSTLGSKLHRNDATAQANARSTLIEQRQQKGG